MGSPNTLKGTQVRHILIIFSILLLGCVKNQTSTEFVQGTEFLYQYETSSGLIFKSFGDGKVQPKYKGEITNGKPNGFGVLTYPYGEKSVVGVWKNGKEWYTKHAKKDGTLIGKFENGEWIVSWGVLYMGYRNGKVGYYTEKWEGVVSKGNQDVAKYEGDIRNGKPNGQGTVTLSDGGKYEGDIRNGESNGQGTYTYPRGGKYVGVFKNGNRNGHGTYTFPDGRKYVGESKDGQWDGQGTITYPDGRKYVGEFKDEEFHGKGTLTRPDGGKYVGEFKNGKIHGQGTYTFEKGKYEGFKYVGEWKDGTQQGQGTDSLPDGSNYVGEWKDGERWNGTLYDKEGKIIGKYINGWFDQ